MRSVAEVAALVFDVFGTLVDWRRTIAREVEAVGRAHGVSGDWQLFTQRWHAEGYQGGMNRVRNGELPWTSVAELHRLGLSELLPELGLQLSSSEVDELARVWRRLDPWPDVAAGLARLKSQYVIAPLSNGDFDMLVDLARHGGFVWDAIFAAELFGVYKPRPETYQGVARLLRLDPGQVMLVASHAYDLRAAQAEGLRTAFVHRPLEYGPDIPRQEPDPSFDFVVDDLLDLAAQLAR
jgi:2-haloacid dehalogenase